MGALCSGGDVVFVEQLRVAGQDDIAMVLFSQHLQLAPRDLDKFFRIFTAMEAIERDAWALGAVRRRQEQRRISPGDFDEDAPPEQAPPYDGTILRDTMFAHMEIPDTVVNQRLFGAFPDPLFAGKINFSAFACQLWHFLSFNTKWLANLLFYLFNEHNRHFLTHGQLASLVTSCLEREVEPPVLQKIVRLVPRLPMEITHAVFHSFLASHPLLLRPLSALQTRLRGACLGPKFWRRQQARRCKLKQQLCTDYAERLHAVEQELLLRRALCAEVDLRMDEWRAQKKACQPEPEPEPEGTFSLPVDLLAAPPPSLRVLQLSPQHLGEQTRAEKIKKPRKRHMRKTPQQQELRGPFGGPAEWLGRAGELPVLQMSPELRAALDEKNALKQQQRARRGQLRGKNARVAAEQKKLEEHQQLGLRAGQQPGGQQVRPRVKYLPKLEAGLKPPPPTGWSKPRMSYVDNLWD